MKKHIPNLLTLSNLFCGAAGIVRCMEGYPTEAAYLIMLAAVFDFLDGFVARMLRVSSPLGKELDSLADCITFGVLPSMIMYTLMLRALSTTGLDSKWAFTSLFMALFAAYRLAKFNIDTNQSEQFIGVPTPANALLIGSFPLIIAHNGFLASYLQVFHFLGAITLLMSFLMTARLPLLALKFKSFDWRTNYMRYVLILGSLVCLLLLRFDGIPAAIGLYVLISVFGKYKPSHSEKKPPALS
ncbi:MAG: CDP-diacylglycerol--serine O-phosphatidyltransferase [Cytophagales bacterium]|nr:MAG: CDP-diacylglycerol--serine O-phosphatidyltransferase [Cytophagales bacterium]TAF61456.1 MAG: CDP-diacylglycerol--serine O-phosphatidyltransferase [Cytophagales bacterium]